MSLTVGSLFAGIGGMDLGLERAGHRVRWQVEIDPFCRKVLAKHWPDVKRYEDVRDVGAHNLEPVDLICGGFPCQDISTAGKRAGIAGERSGLWGEYARIICELRPRYVLVENVAALLVRGIDRVLGDLAESGYDAEWDCLPASAFGAPHRRDRVFILAYASRERLEAYASQAELRFSALDAWSDGYAAAGDGQGVLPLSARTRSVVPGPSLLGMDDRPADGVDRLRGLGNAVVPQVAEWIGRRLNLSLESLSGAPRPQENP